MYTDFTDWTGRILSCETTNANKFKNNEDKCQGELRTLNSDVSDADY